MLAVNLIKQIETYLHCRSHLRRFTINSRNVMLPADILEGRLYENMFR